MYTISQDSQEEEFAEKYRIISHIIIR